MKSHRLPASVRYFKARLRPATSPAFWITSLILSVVSLLLWEVWTNPQWLSQWSSPGRTSSANGDVVLPELIGDEVDTAPDEELEASDLSPEEAAIAADMDNISVLLRDLNTVDAAPDLSKADPSDLNTISVPKAPSGNSSPQIGGLPNLEPQTNPFAVYSQNNPFSNLSTASTSNGNSSGGNSLFALPIRTNLTGNEGSQTTNNTANNAPVNPLQSALERNTAPNSNANANAAVNPSSTASDGLRPAAEGLIAPASQQLSIPSTPINYVSPVNSNPTVPYTTPASNSYNYLTQTSPNPGLPPVTVPAPVSPAGATPGLPNINYGTSLQTPNLQTGFNNQTPSFTSPGLQPSQLNSNTAPFSVNTRVPGRTLGGGRINTFSNP